VGYRVGYQRWVRFILVLAGVYFNHSAFAGNLSPEEIMAKNYLIEAVNTINRLQMQNDVVYEVNNVKVADACVSFMDKSAVLGSNGKDIYQKFIKHADLLPNLVEGGSVQKDCKPYSNMRLEEKGLVWVVIMTMIAHFESSCEIKAEREGPNGTASGYYQLHLNNEAMYDGKGLELCEKGASRKSEKSNSCALGIMQYQFEKQNDNLFSPKSYWDVLRPAGESKKTKLIRKAIQNMNLCNPTVA
jgi:hypothetical protein